MYTLDNTAESNCFADLVLRLQHLRKEQAAIKNELTKIREDIFVFLECHSIEPGEPVVGSDFVIRYKTFCQRRFEKDKVEQLLNELGLASDDYQRTVSYKHLIVDQ